jgi:HSP20 family protein
MALPTRVNRNAYVDPSDGVRNDFNSMLSRFFDSRQWEPGTFAPYGVDVREDADHLYVEAELPGFKKDQVNITLENHNLMISAERNDDRPDPAQKKGEWLLRERRYNRYQRAFTLPSTVSDLKCDAKLTDGVLTITLDKREETKPRRISVT